MQEILQGRILCTGTEHKQRKVRACAEGIQGSTAFGIQTVHVKGWTQAGKEEAANKDMDTVILDLTTRVLSSTQVSGSLGKKGRKRNKQGGVLSSSAVPPAYV